MRMYYKAKRTIKNIAVATRNILAFAAGILMGSIAAVACFCTLVLGAVVLLPLLMLGVFAACFLDLNSLIRQDPVPFGTKLVTLKDAVVRACRRLSHEAYSVTYKATVIASQGFKEFLNFISKPISYFFAHKEWYNLSTGEVVYEEEIKKVDSKPRQSESASTIPRQTDELLNTPALLPEYDGRRGFVPVGTRLPLKAYENIIKLTEGRFPGVGYRM